MEALRAGVGRVGELLRHKDLRILRRHTLCRRNAFGDAVANVAGVVDKHDFGAVVADKEAAFGADGVRHDDDGLVAANGTDQSQAYSLVAARRLDDDGVFMNQAFLLGGTNPSVCGPCFNGSADVKPLELDENLGAVRTDHMLQADNGRMPDCFQNVVKYHVNPAE